MANPPPETVSFEDASGAAPISFEDAAGGEPVAETQETGYDKPYLFTPETTRSPFLATVNSRIDAFIKSFSEDFQKTGKIDASKIARPVAGAVVGLGEASVTGLYGLSQMAKKKQIGVDQAVEGIQSGAEFAANLRKMGEKVTGVNLAPADKVESALTDLLAVMPEGIHAAGETVYEKTGDAFLAAGAEGVLTLLTLKPGIAGKVFKATPKAEGALGELATTKPKEAQELADHVKPEDPALAAKMETQIAEAQAKPMEKGQEAGEAETIVLSAEEGLAGAAADITPDLGQFSTSIEGGELLAQESGKYLQVKRIDVVEAERGKGKAQDMMAEAFEQAQEKKLTLSSDVTVSPDAQRVYEGLQRRGFSIRENPSTINPETGSKVSADPRVPVYEVVEAPRSEAAIAEATQIFANGPTLADLPGGKFAEGKLKAWYDEIIRTIAPEALGQKAKMAAAVLANKIAETMHLDAANWGRSAERRAFWERNAAKSREFMQRFEKGEKQADPVLEKAAENIRQRNKEIHEQDTRNGVQYDPIDNYLYHAFEDSEAVAGYFQRKYGAKWGDPSFTKDRSFDLYEEAIAAGFKPKFTNPEEIMLARQHASDIAQMRTELLKDLETYGMAQKITKANPDPPKGRTPYNYRRSPAGDGYWVDATADAVLHNAFDTQSLWNVKGIRGDIFKAAMFLKNALVPIKLALSLFHPLHVATIDNATGMVRATKELLAGGSNPARWLKGMVLSAFYKGFISSPRAGFRLLKAYQGKLDPAKLTNADKAALQYMAEGGMIPEMSAQFKTQAIESFKKAVQRRSAAALWHAPFAALSLLQKPMFEIWIPSLKIASYIKDVQTAMKVNPDLAINKGQRLLALRKLAKSIDNRYGEMAYNTLFWNRMVKDIAVANTLSLGWQMGFIREYGGGILDIGQSTFRAGKLAEKAKSGMLDRPLFVTFYTTQALLYGGLLTWALTGQPPTELMDYIYPKSGNKNEKGEDERLNTMFYPREFAAIEKHIEHQGFFPGIGHLISSKASGLIGMVSEWATGVNSFDQEIRDPNAPLNKQIQQTLAATLTELEPISVASVRESSGSVKDAILGFSGFSKAPKYVTQTNTEASITELYRKYNAPKQTPYEKALLSTDMRKLKANYKEGDMDAYGTLLDEMVEKYELTAKEQMRIAQTVMKSQDFNPIVSMYQRLTWQQQRRLLDKMSADEREQYLPFSNREHLRFTYEPPEERTSGSR